LNTSDDIEARGSFAPVPGSRSALPDYFPPLVSASLAQKIFRKRCLFASWERGLLPRAQISLAQ
jgi:hypothetical protein